MDNQFLRQVASLFAKEDDLKEYTFIFPNRRSSLFFRMYLGQEHGKPMFAPRIKTISELFEGLSDLEVADKLVLVFRLWKVYTSLQEDLQIASGIKQEEVVTESLDDFMAWGNTLKLTSIKLVMPSSHLILCRPLLLLPQSLPTSESFPMSQLFT